MVVYYKTGLRWAEKNKNRNTHKRNYINYRRNREAQGESTGGVGRGVKKARNETNTKNY